MFRPLLAVVASFLILVPSSQATAGSAAGSTVFRLRGSFVPDSFAGGSGPGWSVGGGAGWRLNSSMLLTANYDRVDLSDRQDRLIQPLTLQLETRFQPSRRVTPHLMLGAGVYRREEWPQIQEVPVQVPGSLPFGESNPSRSRESLFGFTYGLGVSAPVSKAVSMDVGISYHQTLDRDLQGTRSHSTVLSTLGAGLTYSLP